jgi:AcrR family transcriptional regulator
VPRYHHGNLRRELIDATVTAVAEDGPASVSLRDVSRRVGVSHAAPVHHFADKVGLLTAVAAEGFQLLAQELEQSWKRHHDFAEVGVTYVRFALMHRGYFEIMFRPDLLRPSDPELTSAAARSAASLYGPLAAAAPGATEDELRDAGRASWSLMHGFATLWLAGNFSGGPTEASDADAEQLARRITAHLLLPRPASR